MFNRNNISPGRQILRAGWLPLLGIAVMTLLSLLWSIESLSLADIFSGLSGYGDNVDSIRQHAEYSIIVNIRAPRILLAILAGGGLGLAGALFQILLRNVLADPYILGIASGATVGAYLVSLTGAAAVFFLALPLGAFAGSILVAALVYSLSRGRFASDHNALLLSGVMVGTFLSAFTLMILSAERSTYQQAMKWLLGSLANATLDSIVIIVPAFLVAAVIIARNTNALNILSLGNQPSQLLGLSPKRFTLTIYITACILTSTIVSFTGSIGFVGLVIPHICRIYVGTDNRVLMPIVFLVGALFLLVADFIARIVLFPVELPVGAVTALLGAPLFIYLLRKAR